MYDEYAKRGLEFDDMYGWEAAKHDPQLVWSKVPAHVKHKYRFYNVPAQSDPNSPDNPLNMLRRVARVEDFVVLKLDIDNTAVETALIMQLLESKELAGLVDELFWEHHTNQTPMTSYWSTQNERVTIGESYGIFQQLRRLGIRAHSWV
eukprot:NODE_3637_length_750_cov_66.059914_g3052_i0.p1 GENE.NODE_3637_length_750_cov_66.059914_g3052_i0~~NODE_3637_length_750_cov_66.059914_g3052_i0.p1  ORF type:complete len:149 (-),score=47.32 NODE_3637_length_750_cov_66.059914_g3052_i0:98-544(-)